VISIIGLERSRWRQLGFVLVATLGVFQQGGNNRQQPDHDDASNHDAGNQKLDERHRPILPRQSVKRLVPTSVLPKHLNLWWPQYRVFATMLEEWAREVLGGA